MGSGWPLVGRFEEIAEVSDAIAQPGGYGGVVLAGAAGVGKTRLAREALALAQRQQRRCRWIVATGSARSVPLGAFAEFAANFGPDPVRRVQELIDALVGSSPPGSTVIGVDDAHLLDEQSALVIYQLVRQQAATVVLTVRTGETPPDAIVSLWKDEGIPRFDLQPLSANEIAVLVANALEGEVESATANRLWQYTRGNVLYLRQLLADEFASGRISRRAGMWVWDGHPDFSPTLIELIEANIGRQSASVVQVLDVLAVAEPLEVNVLRSLAAEEAIGEAEARGLITIDLDTQADRIGGADRTPLAHFSHPMFGEVRRNRASKLRLRALRADVAEAIGAHCAPSLQQTVRRAVLVLESDRGHDPALLENAAVAALQLQDLTLAQRLAQSAIAGGGGRSAQLLYAWTLSSIGRGSKAEEVLADLSSTTLDAQELARLALFRAVNTAWNLGRPDAGEAHLDAAAQASEVGPTTASAAIRAGCRLAAGDPADALTLAQDALSDSELDGFASMFGWWAMVGGFGETGRVDRLLDSARRGYTLAENSSEASHLRFGLGLIEADGLRLVGRIDLAQPVAAELRQLSEQVEAYLDVTAATVGLLALSRGDLATAQRWLREGIVQGTTYADIAGSVREICEVRLTIALAISGERQAAAQALETSVRFSGDEFRLFEADRLLAKAWVDAVSGLTAKASAAAIAAADLMRAQNRPTREVLCLQTATQFGSAATAGRLAELAVHVEGPRAAAASAHATALHAGDGPGLLAASDAYERFGDRVAAADSAAQAAVVLRDHGLGGSALTATAIARRLADSCGADTPAIRVLNTPSVLTDRQREIIALAASGLTNRQIAARLFMSVRTVEGHLFRASQRAGVNTREELIALLDGRPRAGPQA